MSHEEMREAYAQGIVEGLEKAILLCGNADYIVKLIRAQIEKEKQGI